MWFASCLVCFVTERTHTPFPAFFRPHHGHIPQHQSLYAGVHTIRRHAHTHYVRWAGPGVDLHDRVVRQCTATTCENKRRGIIIRAVFFLAGIAHLLSSVILQACEACEIDACLPVCVRISKA